MFDVEDLTYVRLTRRTEIVKVQGLSLGVGVFTEKSNIKASSLSPLKL